MGGRYHAAPRDSLAPIADAIEQNARRVQRLEVPTGTSTANLVEQVKAAIVGISAQVSAAVSALPSISVPGNITTTGGNLLAPGGSVVAAGDVVSSTASLRGVNVYATGAPGFTITGTRVAGWWETATGRAGTATSSRRFKGDISELGPDRRILAVGIYHWSYLVELRKRDDPTFEEYVGPHYHVGTNIGPMAEDLHAAGLWEYVIYERETVYEIRQDEDGNDVEVVVGDRLKLGPDGEPIPYAIHDSLMAYAVIPVVQDHDERLERIEQHLGLGAD